MILFSKLRQWQSRIVYQPDKIERINICFSNNYRWINICEWKIKLWSFFRLTNWAKIWTFVRDLFHSFINETWKQMFRGFVKSHVLCRDFVYPRGCCIQYLYKMYIILYINFFHSHRDSSAFMLWIIQPLQASRC